MLGEVLHMEMLLACNVSCSCSLHAFTVLFPSLEQVINNLSLICSVSFGVCVGPNSVIGLKSKELQILHAISIHWLMKVLAFLKIKVFTCIIFDLMLLKADT